MRLLQQHLPAVMTAISYPSIEPYHRFDQSPHSPGGSLVDTPMSLSGNVIGTEKVDGENACILTLPGGQWIIASRKQILTARGDVAFNPHGDIVTTLSALADRLPDPVVPTAHYLEVYGRHGEARRNYTQQRRIGYRLFDVAELPELGEFLDQPSAAVAAWRDHGGRRFLSEPDLTDRARDSEVEVTPRLFTLDAAELPTTIPDTARFLHEKLPATLVALDDTARGAAEGIVVRTPGREQITKLRHQTYRRALTTLR